MSKSDDKSESDDRSKCDEKSGWKEWTDLDSLHGELIARELNDRVDKEVEHFDVVHNRNVFDAVADFFFDPTPPECSHPGCDAERFLAEEDPAESESWWERWFRRSGDGNDGESGSSD